MKTFIPKGDKFVITAASFIAPQNSCGFTANKSYDMDSCRADEHGNVIHGLATNDHGEEFWISNRSVRAFPEFVVFKVESSFNNHAAQKKALRFRHMMIRAFVKHAYSYGLVNSKLKRTAFIINRKRGVDYATHTVKEWARQMAEPYFNADGSLAKIHYMIDTPDHEINQDFFDEMAYEDLSSW